MRLGRRHYGDDDSLQADVMRFMAIVAFCLIAILAMVRQTSPASQSDQASDPKPVSQLAQVTEPPLTAESARMPEPEPQPRPDPEPQPEPEPEPEPEPDRQIETEMTLVEVNLESPVVPETNQVEVDATGSPAPAQDAEDPGLTLRFASDRDFLRLVGKGRVNVYAYNDEQFLALDRSHRFHATDPPAQVYELDPSTIPTHMRRALPYRDGSRATNLGRWLNQQGTTADQTVRGAGG